MKNIVDYKDDSVTVSCPKCGLFERRSSYKLTYIECNQDTFPYLKRDEIDGKPRVKEYLQLCCPCCGYIVKMDTRSYLLSDRC